MFAFGHEAQSLIRMYFPALYELRMSVHRLTRKRERESPPPDQKRNKSRSGGRQEGDEGPGKEGTGEKWRERLGLERVEPDLQERATGKDQRQRTYTGGSNSRFTQLLSRRMKKRACGARISGAAPSFLVEEVFAFSGVDSPSGSDGGDKSGLP